MLMNGDAKKAKISVIDDEKDLVEALKDFLEPRNFTVSFAYDGRSGLEIIRKEKPDVVLLDIAMPDIDGRDVLVELKNNDDTKDIPVIMLTCKSAQVEIDYGMELGASAYITKPYESPHLLRQIAHVLDEKRSEDFKEKQ